MQELRNRLIHFHPRILEALETHEAIPSMTAITELVMG